jgi:hypothetical protein
MFNKIRCKNCGAKVKSDWNFCPKCGNSLKEKPVFEDLEKEFRKSTRFPKISMRPGRGITITISGRPRRKPIKIISGPRIERPKFEREKPKKTPKYTEEPETKVKHVGTKDIIQIKLPEVKSQDDIEVRRFEQSIEVRAFVGDKAYFKLIPVSSRAEILKKEFKDNILKVEITR